YPAGMLLAAIPAMALVDSRGVRPTTIAGLVILIAATLAVGWGATPPLLDAARLVQRTGGALSCAGALASLTSTTPEDPRAAAIAAIFAASFLLAAVLNVMLGRLSDLFGRLAPTLGALVVAAVLLPLLPFLDALLPLAFIPVIAGAAVSGLWAPTAVMVTDGADPGPMGQTVAVATMNAAWAAGGAGGAVVVASLADTVGFIPPFVLVGV